jgi:hypothetical protein
LAGFTEAQSDAGRPRRTAERMLVRLAAAGVVALALASSAWAQTSGFTPPVGANITASATATTGAFSAALPAVAGKVNFICGFILTSGGTAGATTVSVTVTGLVSGTLNLAYVAPATGQGNLALALPQCIGASAVDTAITISVPALGAGTTAAVALWGFQV